MAEGDMYQEAATSQEVATSQEAATCPEEATIHPTLHTIPVAATEGETTSKKEEGQTPLLII